MKQVEFVIYACPLTTRSPWFICITILIPCCMAKWGSGTSKHDMACKT